MTMTTNDQRHKLEEIVGHFDNAMLVTTDEVGAIRARPMRIVERGADLGLWFLSSRHTGKIGEVQHELHAAVILQGKGEYACLSGMATVAADRATLQRLWSPLMKPWFPDGPDTPDLVAIHFEPTEGAYWDASGIEGVKYLLRAVKAAFKGERIEDTQERHGSIPV